MRPPDRGRLVVLEGEVSDVLGVPDPRRRSGEPPGTGGGTAGSVEARIDRSLVEMRHHAMGIGGAGDRRRALHHAGEAARLGSRTAAAHVEEMRAWPRIDAGAVEEALEEARSAGEWRAGAALAMRRWTEAGRAGHGRAEARVYAEETVRQAARATHAGEQALEWPCRAILAALEEEEGRGGAPDRAQGLVEQAVRAAGGPGGWNEVVEVCALRATLGSGPAPDRWRAAVERLWRVAADGGRITELLAVATAVDRGHPELGRWPQPAWAGHDRALRAGDTRAARRLAGLLLEGAAGAPRPEEAAAVMVVAGMEPAPAWVHTHRLKP